MDFSDTYVAQLQGMVSDIKQSRRMEERYMLTELLMQDERRAGREEGRIEGHAEGRKDSILESLEEYGVIPDELYDRIMKESDLNKLKKWTKLAVHVETIEQFMSEM